MKTLTTLTAVAALIAGISLASAQYTTVPNSGAMGSSSGSTMGAPPQAAGTGQFCLNGQSGPSNCTFASLADCQKAVKSGESCAPNPKSATTGSKQ